MRRAITAINERDVDAYLALCNSDFELINQIAAIAEHNKGEQGIRLFFEGIAEATAKFELEIERLQPLDGNRVLGPLVLHLETAGRLSAETAAHEPVRTRGRQALACKGLQ